MVENRFDRDSGMNSSSPNSGGYRKDYSNQRSGYEQGAKKSFKPKPASNVREKTETQSFISLGEEKIETLFPVPVNSALPAFQRSLGMAEGIIIEANEKGNGTVEIDGFKYPMKENRTPVIQKRYPLNKYIGKTVKFSFYPTITTKGIKILGLKPEAPPFIKISNFRRELPKQGAVEAIGTIKDIKDNHFTVSIWSAISKKEYVVIIFGKCTAKNGDFVKVDSVLKDGLIQVETIQVLNKK
ncbi:MAG: hypothetical protein H7263_01380 [Candidatus Sericytochromatia bacterium]|nr:hypothetical protein [Candidatus Sericytochromatia bacterium]